MLRNSIQFDRIRRSYFNPSARGVIRACALIGIVFIGAAWSIYLRGARNAGSHMVDAIQIASTALQLGEVWGQSGITCEIPVANTSNQTVFIDDWLVSCACAEIDPPKLSIAPRSKHIIMLKINVPPTSDRVALPTPFRVEIAPVVRGNELARKSFDVSGRMRPICRITPPAVQFPSGSLTKGLPFSTRDLIVEALGPAQ